MAGLEIGEQLGRVSRLRAKEFPPSWVEHIPSQLDGAQDLALVFRQTTFLGVNWGEDSKNSGLARTIFVSSELQSASSPYQEEPKDNTGTLPAKVWKSGAPKGYPYLGSLHLETYSDRHIQQRIKERNLAPIPRL